MDIFEAMATTRAIRRIKPDPVSDEDLHDILFAATRAPSGTNRQPFRFLVLRDGPVAKEAKALLGESFRKGWEAKRASDGVEVEGDSHRARNARAIQQFVERDLRALLGIPDAVAISATIPIGHPEGHHGPVRRRPLRELVFDDRWDGPAHWAGDD